MKKHNEGYTLPLVLVVMLVLTIVAASVLSISLSNLKAQQADIRIMQAKYEAQGEIEKVVSLIEQTEQSSELAELLAELNKEVGFSCEQQNETVVISVEKKVDYAETIYKNSENEEGSSTGRTNGANANKETQEEPPEVREYWIKITCEITITYGDGTVPVISYQSYDVSVKVETRPLSESTEPSAPTETTKPEVTGDV